MIVMFYFQNKDSTVLPFCKTKVLLFCLCLCCCGEAGRGHVVLHLIQLPLPCMRCSGLGCSLLNTPRGNDPELDGSQITRVNSLHSGFASPCSLKRVSQMWGVRMVWWVRVSPHRCSCLGWCTQTCTELPWEQTWSDPGTCCGVFSAVAVLQRSLRGTLTSQRVRRCSKWIKGW